MTLAAHMPSIPLPVTHSPLEAATHLRRRRGFVWLDSSLERPEPPGSRGLSLLASEPDLILDGGADVWHLLEQELKRRERPSETQGMPDGAAIGYFRFDGSYRFGFYDHPLLHGPSGWVENPSDHASQHRSEGGEIASASPTFQPEMQCDGYMAMVRAAQEYIAAGDIYQVCLAHRFSAPFAGDPWPLYLALRNASPSPHAALLNLGDETVLSSSPECFLKMSGRRISTRPIKGTRPRKQDRNQDELEAFELKTSPKEIAELVMITDLERNDLGSVCEFGSVSASQLLHLERYAQVFHLVSTVEGRLREGVDALSALRDCFPGGSITGAPKKRAREVIAELEGRSRGLYTGALGWFGASGESAFNILIRTVVVEEGGDGKPALAHFDVGAGVVADSVPEQEWQETWDKAAGILLAAERMRPKRSVSAGSCVARTSLSC